jgi:hypothetical protein
MVATIIGPLGNENCSISRILKISKSYLANKIAIIISIILDSSDLISFFNLNHLSIPNHEIHS